MDGNGRWAKSKFRPRLWGHVRGSSIVSEIIEEARDLKLNSLTLYAFSSENWSRPKEEINGLFKLLDKYLVKEKKRILENNICFKVIGDISALPEKTKTKISELEDLSSQNGGLKLYFAFSYGSQQEILRSVNIFINRNPGQKMTAQDMAAGFYSPEIPQIDLLIRTSGEMRISNFLLWQLAYAELYFSPTLWPDFSKEEFRSIIKAVSTRERRFGSLLNEADLTLISQKADSQKAQFREELN